jgi:hypothetical protein
MANDRYYDWALTFLQSLREHNATLPLHFIPYDDNTGRILSLRRHFGFEPVPFDYARIDAFARRLFPNRDWNLGNLRKYAALDLDYDELAYFDVDMLLFADPARLFGHIAPGAVDMIYLSTSDDWVYERDQLPLARSQFGDMRLFSAGAYVTSRRILTFDKVEATIEADLDLYRRLRKSSSVDQAVLNFVAHRSGMVCRHIGECDLASAGMVSFRYPDIRFEGGRLVQPSTGRHVAAVHWAGGLKQGLELISPRLWPLRRHRSAVRRRAMRRLAGASGGREH